jgi:Leucine-rich repeat (LRR) protein
VLSSNALPALLPHHVAGLAALTRLDLSRNRLADLAGLAGLPRLAVLLLGRNRLQDSSLQHITVRQARCLAAARCCTSSHACVCCSSTVWKVLLPPSQQPACMLKYCLLSTT